MEYLVWAGAAVSLIGLGGLVYCIGQVWRARRAGMGEDEMRDLLKRVVPVNSCALFLSMIGLMMVVVGIVLS